MKVVRCEGCNRYLHPRNVMLVDPHVINVHRAPLYLCIRCRRRLVWRKVESTDVRA